MGLPVGLFVLHVVWYLPQRRAPTTTVDFILTLPHPTPLPCPPSPPAANRQPSPPSSSTAASAVAGHDSFQLSTNNVSRHPHRRLMEQFSCHLALTREVFFASLLYKSRPPPPPPLRIHRDFFPRVAHGAGSRRLAGAANLGWSGCLARRYDVGSSIPPNPINDESIVGDSVPRDTTSYRARWGSRRPLTAARAWRIGRGRAGPSR